MRRWLTTHRLDPRPENASQADPYDASVNIPLGEIAGRAHELPSRNVTVQVAAHGELAERTVKALHEMGRPAVVTEPAPQSEKLLYKMWEENPMLRPLKPAPQTALDLACGSGRDAVFLANLGYRVTAVDALEDALERARDLERRYNLGPAIAWQRMDLEREVPSGKWHLVTMFRYCQPTLIERAHELLEPGGELRVEVFTPTHFARYGKPRHHTTAEQLADHARNLAIVACGEDWRGDVHTARLVARL
jgi:tellurite methyltransferase